MIFYVVEGRTIYVAKSRYSNERLDEGVLPTGERRILLWHITQERGGVLMRNYSTLGVTLIRMYV